MSKKIVEVNDLSKFYRLNSTAHYETLRDSLVGLFKRNKSTKSSSKSFWALKNVSFEAEQGEVLGIIGRNGAGKSTLLKILSRITYPTKGEAFLRGRVGSLLEVGTGFHQELSGRENIYLNGVILGMREKEIKKKFDEIVDFSGVEKFLDTPVKFYSSGMRTRLAFSVAAFLEPEILIIDEVLSVGDAEFQKRSLGKMNDVAKNEGRTVLFVSHNTSAVKTLCDRCILLDDGKKIFDGNVDESFEKYEDLQHQKALEVNHGTYDKSRRGSGTLSFTNVKIKGIDGKERNIFANNDTACFDVGYKVFRKVDGLYFNLCLFSSKSNDFVVTNVQYEVLKGNVEAGSSGKFRVSIKLNKLQPGEYPLYFWLGDKDATTVDTPTHYDVIDKMTKPLIIRSSRSKSNSTRGVFKLESKFYR